MEVVPASFHTQKTASCFFLYLPPRKSIKKYVYYSAEPLAKSSKPIYSYNKLDKVLDVRNGNVQTKQMSCSSMGVMEGNDFKAVDRTAFGETLERECVQFLHRQIGDPLGYPDGWNNWLGTASKWGITNESEPLKTRVVITGVPGGIQSNEQTGRVWDVVISLNVLSETTVRFTIPSNPKKGSTYTETITY